MTANIVRASRFGGKLGANAFRHSVVDELKHGPISETLEAVAKNPGRVIGCSIAIPPGGNEVESYLDLLISEPSEIEAALQEAHLKIADSASPERSSVQVEAALQQGMFRFSCDEGIEPLAALEQLKSAARTSQEAPAPLRIFSTQEVGERGGALLFYRLEQPTVERLRKLHGSDWQDSPVRVHEDVHHQFVDIHGPLMPHIIEVLTGLNEKDIEGLGGLILTSSSGEVTELVPAAAWLR